MEDPSKQQPPPYPTQQGAGGFAPPPYPTQAPGVPPYPAQAPPPAGYKPPENYGYSTQPGQVWKTTFHNSMSFFDFPVIFVSRLFSFKNCLSNHFGHFFRIWQVYLWIILIFWQLFCFHMVTFLAFLSRLLEKYHKCFSKLKYDSQSSLRGSVNHQFIFIRDSILHLMLIVL